MPEPTKCLRCQGSLVEGYVPDASYASIFVPSWIEGAPEYASGWLSRARSGWLGKALDPKRLMSKTRLTIVTYRCTSCGMLESYAPSAQRQ
jgi:hypothetical protein